MATTAAPGRWPIEVDVYGCHRWAGRHDRDGYAVTWRGNARPEQAHRVAWEQFNGPLPADLELDHVCRRRNCVRPEHLEAVTRRENVRRRSWRYRVRMRTCAAGHDAFQYGRRTPEGGRVCTICAPIDA